MLQGFRRPEGSDDYMEPRNTLYVDLRPTEEEILAQMKPKGRYNIRVAQRHRVSVVEDTSAQGLADFLRIYRRMSSRQGIDAKPAPGKHGFTCIVLQSGMESAPMSHC